MTIVPFPPQTQVYYPESDGKPTAETLNHILVITYLLDVLMTWFRDQKDMYVGANNLIYYEVGFPKASFAPDVYLIPGLDKTPRRVLKLWEEKRAPAVIFEITSRATWEEDLGDKLELYARLGVLEYFVYDVEHEELAPPCVVFDSSVPSTNQFLPMRRANYTAEKCSLPCKRLMGHCVLSTPATEKS